MNKKILCVYTKYYPYSKYEVHVGNEIKVLSSYFDEIYVFPGFSEADRREVPENVFVRNDFIKKSELPNRLPNLVKAAWIVFCQLFDRSFLNKLKNIVTDFSYCYSKSKEADQLEEVLKKDHLSNAMHYSVWMNDWALVLAILKKKRQIREFHCRAHGYDMFHHRYVAMYVPFRDVVIRKAKSVTCVSKAGYDYLRKQYPDFKPKVQLMPLGVFDLGTSPFSNRELNFVTACNANEVKRVEKIVESFRFVTSTVNWYYFGEGPLLENIKKLTLELPENIKVHLMGRVTSNDLFEFYKTHTVSAFILVSSSEGGVPVAIQEAMSFGIPVIATNVGGVPDIIDSDTGILLEVDFQLEKLGQIINNFTKSALNNENCHEKVKIKWSRNYSAEKNYGKFARYLLSE